ncbi:MAG: class I SAM-dependent methyltransferase [Cellulomonas sp.]|nr:class I SAM-dependent methyltransferase [Cellulomonas sp.]
MADPDDERRRRRTQAVARAIRSDLGPGAHGRAVDIGAGAGGVSVELADLFEQLVLVDVDAAALAHAAGALAQIAVRARVRTAEVDLSDPAAPPHGLGPVDVVYSVLALHHVQRTDLMLAAVHDLLAPGGRLLVADLDSDGGGYHAHRTDFAGHNGFDRTELAAVLHQCGFRVDGDRTIYVDTKLVGGEPRDFPIFLISATRTD